MSFAAILTALSLAVEAFGFQGGLAFGSKNMWVTLPLTSGPTNYKNSPCHATGGGYYFIFGGVEGSSAVNTGYLFQESTQTWSAVTTLGAPSARSQCRSYWTGSRFLVYGGNDATWTTYYADGALYDPSNNTWSPMATSGAPSARSLSAVAWTGTLLILWGGQNASSALSDGAVYNATTNTWSAMATSGAPSARTSMAVSQQNWWTGTHLVVWGGDNWTSNLADGALYNPTTNTWTAMGTSGTPLSPRTQVGLAVIPGNKLFFWGGCANSGCGTGAMTDGAIYDIGAGTWTAVPTANAPGSGFTFFAISAMGNRVFLVKPSAGGFVFNTAANAWSSLPTTNLPSLQSSGTISSGKQLYVLLNGTAFRSYIP